MIFTCVLCVHTLVRARVCTCIRVSSQCVDQKAACGRLVTCHAVKQAHRPSNFHAASEFLQRNMSEHAGCSCCSYLCRRMHAHLCVVGDLLWLDLPCTSYAFKACASIYWMEKPGLWRAGLPPASVHALFPRPAGRRPRHTHCQ